MPSATAFLRRHDAHSWYITFAAVLMSLTLAVDLLFPDYIEHRALNWALLVITLTSAVTALFLGRRLPRWVGIVAVFIFLVAQAYFLSLADDPQTVISALQQLPIVAFYLGWFVRPRLALPLIALCMAVFGIVMVSNPLFNPEGRIGAPVAVHGLLSLLFCYIAGNYLWRRAKRVDATDALTGALHRAPFFERAAVRLRRRTTPMSLLAIDFDGFKQVNDAHGHAAGDRALETTVSAWRSELRSSDVIGRLGGDEFAILLPDTDRAETSAIVERLQAASTHPWSWGASEYAAGDDLAALLQRADAALYAQKRLKRQVPHG